MEYKIKIFSTIIYAYSYQVNLSRNSEIVLYSRKLKVRTRANTNSVLMKAKDMFFSV